MLTWEDRVKFTTRSIVRAIRLDHRLQIALFIGAVLIVAIIGYMTIGSFTKVKRDFISYNIKGCYDRNTFNLSDDNSSNFPSQNIHYGWKNMTLIVSYDFSQRCYGRMQVYHSIKDTNISIYLEPNRMTEGCTCKTGFSAEIGPLTEPNYSLHIFKVNGKESYLIEERMIDTTIVGSN